MRKILTIITAFCLFLSVPAGGNFRKSEFTGRLEKTLNSSLAIKDTIRILHWTFNNGMPDVTEVDGVAVANVSYGHTYIDEDFDTGSLGDWTKTGGVDLIQHPDRGVLDSVLEVTVSGGGNDGIFQTITDRDEVWYRLRFQLTDADTVGWVQFESIVFATLGEAAGDVGRGQLRVRLVSGKLLWEATCYDDDVGATSTQSVVEVVTDTWYSLEWHVKKSTAAGADNGISSLSVDGTSVLSKANWDNDTPVYARLDAGASASVLDCIYYIDLVLLADEPNKGLEVTVSGGGSDYILQSISDWDEITFSFDAHITDTDTSGWADGEYIMPACMRQASGNGGLLQLRAVLSSGALEWRTIYYNDAAAFQATVTSTATITTNTWYSLVVHLKKETAPGAGDGICNLKVDDTADVIDITNWENEAAVYAEVLFGNVHASTLDAILYVDNVKLWTPEGLP